MKILLKKLAFVAASILFAVTVAGCHKASDATTDTSASSSPAIASSSPDTTSSPANASSSPDLASSPAAASSPAVASGASQ